MNSQILIEPIIDGVAHKNITQGKKFSFCLRFTNRSLDNSKSFTVLEINIISAEGKSFEDNFSKKSFLIKSLYPNEIYYLCVGDNGFFLTGLLTVELKFNTEGNLFDFYQKNPFAQTLCIPHRENEPNQWCDFLYVDTRSDALQEKTNNLIISFTVITAILGVIQIIPIFYSYFFTP